MTQKTRPRIAVDIDDTLLFDGELSDLAAEVVQELQEHYHVVAFTGRQDIPDEVWDLVNLGECRKPVIDDYYKSGRKWKLDKYPAWKFDVIIDDDSHVLKIADIPVKLLISDETDWEGIRDVLVPGNSQTAAEVVKGGIEASWNQKAFEMKDHS